MSASIMPNFLFKCSSYLTVFDTFTTGYRVSSIKDRLTALVLCMSIKKLKMLNSKREKAFESLSLLCASVSGACHWKGYSG